MQWIDSLYGTEKNLLFNNLLIIKSQNQSRLLLQKFGNVNKLQINYN